MWQVLYNRNQAPVGADKCGKVNHQAASPLWKTLLAQGKHYWAPFCLGPAGQEKHLSDGHLGSFQLCLSWAQQTSPGLVHHLEEPPP